MSGARSEPGCRRIRTVVCRSLTIVVLVALAGPLPKALADADPASDVLLAQEAFFPYQPPVSHGVEGAMNSVLRSAQRAGLHLKVAVIGSREDLGGVPSFFGHPQPYAQFLEREISYNDHPPLLVVMPDGFGVAATGPVAALAGIKIDANDGSDGLVRSGIEAVLALVRAQSKTIRGPATPSSSPGGGGPPVVVLFSVPLALLVLVGVARRTRRRQQG